MPTSITMPRLGESVAEGTIASWLKQVGEYVEKDESLAEIVTDKINAELPSPVAGKLVQILVNVDGTVPVGAAIALIEEDADLSLSPPAEAAPGADAAPVQSLAQAEHPVLKTQSHPSQANGRVAVSQAGAEEEERQRISPLARRLAKEHGIDLQQIAGTGAAGRVRKEDILTYVAQQTVPMPPVVPVLPAKQAESTRPVVPTPTLPVAASSAGEYEELIMPSRMRLAIAEHMVRSKRTSPHATTVVEVDMTMIAKWLAKNKDEFKRREGYGISFVPFVMKAVSEGLRKYPLMNSSWTEDNKILVKKRINLGIAVATELGLVVPTIYDADQYTLAGLARQVSTIAQKARAHKLSIQDLQNSTFVVNNPGVFGTIISVPIINQPHAGILSMDAVVKRPVVIEDDAIAVRSMMYLCLSFDHRILDGEGGAGFLQAVRMKLQSYGREIDIY